MEERLLFLLSSPRAYLYACTLTTKVMLQVQATSKDLEWVE